MQMLTLENTCRYCIPAFDVIDHDLLFRRLEFSYGIAGSALQWLKSYLSDRSQRILIGSTLSEPRSLNIGVPQGSVLGPRIYCMYAKPIGNICYRNKMNYHCYADDTQIYIMIETWDNWNDISDQLSACLTDIQKLDEFKLAEIKSRKNGTHYIRVRLDCVKLKVLILLLVTTSFAIPPLLKISGRTSTLR
jgi:hypothetical protein